MCSAVGQYTRDKDDDERNISEYSDIELLVSIF